METQQVTPYPKTKCWYCKALLPSIFVFKWDGSVMGGSREMNKRWLCQSCYKEMEAEIRSRTTYLIVKRTNKRFY